MHQIFPLEFSTLSACWYIDDKEAELDGHIQRQSQAHYIWQQTHLENFFPVPITMEIVKAIVTVASILLLGTATCFICFGPGLLDSFPTCAADV